MKRVSMGVFGFYMVLVTLAAANGVKALATSCTPATCPPGPVYVEFEHANCTGELSYYGVYPHDQCSYGETIEVTNDGVVYFYTFTDEVTCDRTANNASYEFEFYKYGGCNVNLRRKDDAAVLGRKRQTEHAAVVNAFMYLANVNDSFVAPQNFIDSDVPEFSYSSATCYSPDNCTETQGWRTTYALLNCLEVSTSDFNANGVFDTCLNYYDVAYIKLGCFEEHGSYTAYFSDSACTKPTRVEGIRSVCSADSYTTLHCTAPITTLPGTTSPENPPTSDGTTMHVSVILCMTILALIAIF